MARSLQFFKISEDTKNSEIISIFVYVLNSFFNYRYFFKLDQVDASNKNDKDERNEESLKETNKSDGNIGNETQKVELIANEISMENDQESFTRTKRKRVSINDFIENEEITKQKKNLDESISSSPNNSEEADMVVDLHNFGTRSMSFEKKEVKKNMILRRMSQIYEVKWNDEENISKIVDWNDVWLKEWLQNVLQKSNIQNDEGLVEKRCGLLVFDMNLLEKKMDEDVNSEEYSPAFVIVTSKNMASIERVSLFIIYMEKISLLYFK